MRTKFERCSQLSSPHVFLHNQFSYGINKKTTSVKISCIACAFKRNLQWRIDSDWGL